MFLNEATLLHNLKIRYQKDKIYVSLNFLYVIQYLYITAPVLAVSKLSNVLNCAWKTPCKARLGSLVHVIRYKINIVT